MHRILFILLSIWLVGCAYLPSVKNKLTVSPVKYVPCWENMGPNTSCGSVTVSPQEAEGFIVVVGWKRFEEIISANENDELSKELVFSKFASNEVVYRGYCKEALVPKERRRILGWEGSGDKGIYVICNVENAQ
jgi:hypothetical protein